MALDELHDLVMGGAVQHSRDAFTDQTGKCRGVADGDRNVAVVIVQRRKTAANVAKKLWLLRRVGDLDARLRSRSPRLQRNGPLRRS